MKKISILFLSTLILGTATGIASAEEVKNYDSNGVVSFIPNTDPTDPVNPIDPDPNKPVNPIDPTDPDGPKPGTDGPLSIDFASSLDFGTNKISSKDQVYYARAQTYKNSDGSASDLVTPNYVQVSDNRGTNAGWTLKVKQNGQFKNDTTLNKTLTGSVINLNTPAVRSNAEGITAPVATSDISLDANGSESIVLTAKAGAGAGTWINAWGTVEKNSETDKENNSIEADVTKAISLSVPGKTPKDAVKYTTTLTWALSDIPGN